MALKNIAGFKSFNDYIQDKINRYEKMDKTMETLYSFMFCDKTNVMAEVLIDDEYQKISYGTCDIRTKRLAASLKDLLSDVENGSVVGIYMNNSIEWIQTFWALLMCGYNPLLMNSRLNNDILNKILVDNEIKAVISDSKSFDVRTIMFKDITITEREVEASHNWGTEVLFMSSGTTNNVKLCAYNGENFFYQICDSVNIIKKCPRIVEHYNGELKHLAVLPLYHVFGFIAMYIWFGFFQRTFVFLKDLHPQTLLNTIIEQEVTHIFAVPLLWERVYKGALKKIKMRGEETYNKFLKGIDLANKSSLISKFLIGGAFKEVRENMFGDSVKFLISGGSGISREILSFFNGLGYHLVNGYGMTEVGITSVELSLKKKDILKASIGKPFTSTEYKISDKKELLIKSKTRACKIIQNKVVNETDYDTYFNSNDVARVENGSYYLDGRQDDLIVCKNGENLNPEILEKQIKTERVDAVCLFNSHLGEPTLLISVPNCFSKETLESIQEEIGQRLKETKLCDVVTQVHYTTDKLLGETDFKVSRKKIAIKFKEDKFKLVNVEKIEECSDVLLSNLECKVRNCFAQSLQKEPNEVRLDANFFSDLGGSSLDYFALIDLLKESFEVEFEYEEENILATVKEICDYISKLKKEI